MNRYCIATALFLLSPVAFAAGDLSKQEPTTVTIQMGADKGQHRFTPDALTLETGRLYALRIDNAGSEPYYFGSNGLADAVYTRKVVAKDAAGKVVAEIYGPIRRIEVAPGHSVEWWFLPIRTGKFDDVMSKRSQAEAGMRATIEVK